MAGFDPGDASTKGAGVQIYKNGVRRLGPPSAGVLYNNPQWQIKPVSGTAPLRLGTRNLKHFLVGAIDEVAIYPRVLTAKEILGAGKELCKILADDPDLWRNWGEPELFSDGWRYVIKTQLVVAKAVNMFRFIRRQTRNDLRCDHIPGVDQFL